MQRDRYEKQGGFVAIEFVGAVALLLLPVVMLVSVLPHWSEREHAATTIARESARLAAQRWPDDAQREVDALIDEMSLDLGVPSADISVSLSTSGTRGGQIAATVTIVMPAVAAPGIGTAGRWHWSSTASVRIDDYRSR